MRTYPSVRAERLFHLRLKRYRGSEKPWGLYFFGAAWSTPISWRRPSILFLSALGVRGAGYGLWYMADSRCLSDGEHSHTSRENHLPFPA